MQDETIEAETESPNAIPHDGFVKKLMEHPIAAREFLEEYLPDSFKELVDLQTVKPRKESFSLVILCYQ